MDEDDDDDDGDNDSSTETTSTNNGFSKRMKSMLRYLDTSLAQEQGITITSPRNSSSIIISSSAVMDNNHATDTTNNINVNVIRKKKKSFVELQEEMVALLDYEPFPTNRTLTLKTTTIANTGTSDPSNQSNAVSNSTSTNHTQSDHHHHEKRTKNITSHQPKRVHWEEKEKEEEEQQGDGKEKVVGGEEEDIQQIPTPPRIIKTPQEAAKSVFGPTVFSPPTKSSTKSLIPQQAATLISNTPTAELPLEFDTDSTSSTPNYYYHHNTQPPTYSPLLSRRRSTTFSTTKVIVQRPHSAPSKSKSIRSSTANTAAVKQSPVEELKNRLRIYSATTTAKSQNHSKMYNRPTQQISTASATTTTKSTKIDKAERYNPTKTESHESVRHVDVTNTTTLISTNYINQNSDAINQKSLSNTTSINNQDQLRYQEQLIAQYKMEIDNLNKVNMYQKAQIVKYETAIRGMEKKEELYKIHNTPQHGQPSSRTITRSMNNKKQTKMDNHIIKDDNTNHNYNHVTDSYHPTNTTTYNYFLFKELRQVVKWRQRVINAELNAQEWKRKEEELRVQYCTLQQQYGQALEMVHSLEAQRRRAQEEITTLGAYTQYPALQQKYDEACQQIYSLEQKLQEKQSQSSHRLTAESAVKQLIRTNANMQWNHNNQNNYARSITEEHQELQSCYDALQTQLEEAIEIIYFLEEELEMEKSKKNNILNNTNKLDTNNDMLRRLQMLPSSNGSTQRNDSFATEAHWNSLTGLPLLTAVINTLKGIQDGCIKDSQHAAVHAALNRLREYQSTASFATSNEEVDVVNDDGTIDNTSCQGGCIFSEEDGSDQLLYADSDETKKQSDHIRNLHIDFMKEVEDDETPGRDGPMLLTNAYDDVLGSNKNISHCHYYQRPRDIAINIHQDVDWNREMCKEPKDNYATVDDESSTDVEWATAALRQKCFLLESERDRIVTEALDLVNVTKREAKASAEARMAVLRFAFTQQLRSQESKFQRLATDLESQYHQQLLLIIEKKKSTVLKWKTFLTWRLRITSKSPTKSLNFP